MTQQTEEHPPMNEQTTENSQPSILTISSQDLERLKLTITEKDKQVQELTSELSQLQVDNAKLTELVTSLNNENAKLSKEKETAKQNEQLKKENEQLKEQDKQRQREYNEKNRQLKEQENSLNSRAQVLADSKKNLEQEISKRAQVFVQPHIDGLKAKEKLLEEQIKAAKEKWQEADTARAERRKELLPFSWRIILPFVIFLAILGYFSFWGIKTEIANYRSNRVIYERNVEKTAFNPKGIEAVSAPYIKALINAEFKPYTADKDALLSLCRHWRGILSLTEQQQKSR